MKQIIYVALLDEGVACWRPVEAVHKYDDVYTLASTNADPDEHWEFSNGEDVHCKMRTFSSGSTALTAYAKAA